MFKPTQIVIHHTASADGAGLDRDELELMHKQRGFTEVGYHFIIDKVEGFYTAIVGRPLDLMGSHAKGANQNSIGVAFVGNFDLAAPHPLMIDEGLRLVLIPLVKQLKISPSAIFGHREVGTTPTVCPGKFFPLDDVKARIDRNCVS